MPALILRLAAPMQSWGLQSRFSIRDTAREPTKSGVIGLLAAALGRPRDADISDLMALRMVVRVDREGTVRRDYQTAGGGKLPDGRDYGVAKASGAKGNPVTSNRYYLAEADFRVALEGDAGLLDELNHALNSPHWPLFLGRKAFVPDHPVGLGVRAELSAVEALQQESWFARTSHELKAAPFDVRVVIEVASPDESDDVRPDIPDSFATRNFRLRHVRTETISISSELIREDLPCISRI